jgi:hypothetical protein
MAVVVVGEWWWWRMNAVGIGGGCISAVALIELAMMMMTAVPTKGRLKKHVL